MLEQKGLHSKTSSPGPSPSCPAITQSSLDTSYSFGEEKSSSKFPDLGEMTKALHEEPSKCLRGTKSTRAQSWSWHGDKEGTQTPPAFLDCPKGAERSVV